MRMGTKEAIKYSQKRSAHHLRRKKTTNISIICCSSGQRFFTVIETKHASGQEIRRKNYIVASQRMTSGSLAQGNLSQVWLIIGGRSLTTMASMDGFSIRNARIGVFWGITPLQFGTIGGRRLPRLPGTCWPRKLISILTKLDCTQIQVGSTASGGILLCRRLKTPGQSDKAGSIGT